MSAQTLLFDWLRLRLSPNGVSWLEEKASLLKTGNAGASDKIIFASFSACVRYAGKEPLNLDKSALQQANAAVPDWNPSDWTCDEAARIFLLTCLPASDASDAQKSAAMMDQLFHTADIGEAVALQKAVAVLAYPQGHMARAREAVRSNIKAVFDAIALRNPYPALHFDNVGWNQIVVKTFFVESSLDQIVGLDGRCNQDLANMLTALAQERWAAGRTFNPQLWRCVGPFADQTALEALQKVLARGEPAEKNAAALALKSCPDSVAAEMLAAQPALAAAVKDGSINWENFLHA